MQDADLEQLRETREWLDALDTMRGGLSSKSAAGLRAEAKAPFRLFRIVAFQGLFAGAAIGLLISVPNLFKAVTGVMCSPASCPVVNVHCHMFLLPQGGRRLMHGLAL